VFNKSLNFAVELEGRDAFGRSSRAAIVQAPRALPRLIRLPKAIASAPYSFVFLSSILHAHVGELFAGMSVLGSYQFRVTRNSDLFVDEEEIKNLHTAVQGELLHRHFGDAVRLEVADNCSERMTEFLLQQFGLQEADLYRVEGPVNLYRLREVPDQSSARISSTAVPARPRAGGRYRRSLRRAEKAGRAAASPLPVVPAGDRLHPRHGERSERDRHQADGVSHRHRLGADGYPGRRGAQGKEVTVVVELMARFDEEANLNWAARLEEVGAHVVYGVVGHKTHAKMALVVRRETTPTARCCAAMSTSRPATTIPRPRASTPTSA